MTKLFNKIAIVGVGLIGGSLGIAIKKKRIANKVIGISRKRSTLNRAKKVGAIDEGYLDFEAIRGSDLIILCAPVKTIISLMSEVKPYLSDKCIITDVGSTKFDIVTKSRKVLGQRLDFIGAHPLAGSEKRGIENAMENLFKDSVCILTPGGRNRKSLTKIKLFWKRLGVKVKVLKPELHDKIISLTSQLPHLIAFSLMGSVPQDYLKYAASSLKDTTRVASSDPLLWTQIFLTNRAPILKSIKIFKKQLLQFSDLIERADEKRLFKKIQNAKSKRDKLHYMVFDR